MADTGRIVFGPPPDWRRLTIEEKIEKLLAYQINNADLLRRILKILEDQK